MAGDFEFKSTEEMVKQFEKNIVWQDFKAIVEEWKDGCYQALGDPKQVNNLESLSDYQGRIYICDSILNLPELLIEAIKQEKQGS